MMRPNRKSLAFAGFVFLCVLVCPQLAVPLVESGMLTCALTSECDIGEATQDGD